MTPSTLRIATGMSDGRAACHVDISALVTLRANRVPSGMPPVTP
jgi:hypothetical protein